MARKVADTAIDFHADAIFPCAHDSCVLPAMCKIKIKNAWENLCHKHYDFHYREEAHANFDKYGLAKLPDETTKEHVGRMREFVKQGFRKIGRHV